MSTPDKSEPLLDNQGEETTKEKCKRYGRYTGIGCLIFLGVLFVVMWILQGIVYAFATWGCGPQNLEGYPYPDGDGPKTIGYNSTNVLPRNEVLQYHDGWPSDSFDVTRSTEMGSSGKVGTWFRYGGPIFNTYIFMDTPSGIPTVYIRQNLLRMGMSHRIARCDEKGPYVEFYEGMNWFINRIRHISLIGWMVGKGTDYTFKISVNGEHVADALESVTSGIPSINFATMDHKYTFASGGLDKNTGRWNLYNDFSFDSNGIAQEVPYWVTSGSTMLFAFSKQRRDDRMAAREGRAFLEMPIDLPTGAAAMAGSEEAAVEAAPATQEVQAAAEGGATGGEQQPVAAEPIAQNEAAAAALDGEHIIS